MPEFRDATTFLILFRFTWKFRSSWSFSAATSLLVLLSISASFCHTWELDAASFWFGSLATSLPVLFQSCWQSALSVPGLFDAIGLCTVEEFVAACETKFNVRFWLCHYSLLSLLASFSPSFQGSWWSWNSKSSKLSWNGWCQINGEDGSTHHVASWCLVSIVPCFVNLKNVEHRTKLRRLRVQWNLIDIAQFKLSC